MNTKESWIRFQKGDHLETEELQELRKELEAVLPYLEKRGPEFLLVTRPMGLDLFRICEYLQLRGALPAGEFSKQKLKTFPVVEVDMNGTTYFINIQPGEEDAWVGVDQSGTIEAVSDAVAEKVYRKAFENMKGHAFDAEAAHASMCAFLSLRKDLKK